MTLRRGIPAIVVQVDFEEQLGPAIEAHTELMDDAYWARFVRKPFTWQRFTTWWAARRWVMPRDPRRW